MRMGTSVAWTLLALVAGCRGKLVATADLRGPGTTEVALSGTGARLEVWADYDAKWKGPKSSKPVLEYDIEVLKKGEKVGSVHCSTMKPGSTSVCGSHSNVMGEHDADCESNLACKLPAEAEGSVTLRVTGTLGKNVLSTKKMSLNFREP